MTTTDTVDPDVDDEPTTTDPNVEVEDVPSTDVEVVDDTPSNRAAAAIVAAAAAAIDNPGVPGRDEFLSIAAQARMLSLSGAAPKAVRENPHIAFHVAMIGRDLGLSPSSALDLIDVIAGKDGNYQLSLSPQLLNGQVRRLGLGSIIPAYRGTDRAVAWAMGPRGADPRCLKLCATTNTPTHVDDDAVGGPCRCDLLGVSEFTWEDARMADLVVRGCEPGNHTAKCLNYSSKGWERCNQGYRTYPKRMLWWRASGFCADDYFPEASLGLYSAEALGAVVDDEGRPIDVESVELPDGYGPAALPTAVAGVEAARQASTTTIDPAEAEALLARIKALPDDVRADLKTKWQEAEALRSYKVEALPTSALGLARAMIGGFEAIARRRGDGAPPAAPVESTTPEVADQVDVDEAPTLDLDGSTDDDDVVDAEVVDEAPKPRPDPEVAAWVRVVADRAAAAGVNVDEVVVEVKALHHTKLNAELAEHGAPTDGLHVDTRRMYLVAARLARLVDPTSCLTLGCDDTTVGDDNRFCEQHHPF